MVKNEKSNITFSELRELFPVSDYIKLTGRCPRLAYKDVKQPGFPSIRIGNSIMIVKQGFIEWLEQKQKEQK